MGRRKDIRLRVSFFRTADLHRLAPDFPFPYPQEDSYAALCWVYEHAEELGIDRNRIGIGGDSAGGIYEKAIRQIRGTVKKILQGLAPCTLSLREVLVEYILLVVPITEHF